MSVFDGPRHRPARRAQDREGLSTRPSRSVLSTVTWRAVVWVSLIGVVFSVALIPWIGSWALAVLGVSAGVGFIAIVKGDL